MLFKEMSIFEDTLFKKYALTPDQQELYALDEKLSILQDLFAAGLVKEKYEYYTANKDIFNVQNFIDFFEKKGPVYGFSFTIPANMERLDTYRDNMEKFYAYSFDRDDVFLENINNKLGKDNTSTAVLVTGGFHKDNLKKLFADEGYSYIEVMPKISKVEKDNPYFTLLNGEHTGFDDLMDIIVTYNSGTSNIAIQSMFSEMGIIDMEKRNTNSLAVDILAALEADPQKGIVLMIPTGYLRIAYESDSEFKEIIGEINGKDVYAIREENEAYDPQFENIVRFDRDSMSEDGHQTVVDLLLEMAHAPTESYSGLESHSLSELLVTGTPIYMVMEARIGRENIDRLLYLSDAKWGDSARLLHVITGRNRTEIPWQLGSYSDKYGINLTYTEDPEDFVDILIHELNRAANPGLEHEDNVVEIKSTSVAEIISTIEVGIVAATLLSKMPPGEMMTFRKIEALKEFIATHEDFETAVVDLENGSFLRVRTFSGLAEMVDIQALGPEMRLEQLSDGKKMLASISTTAKLEGETVWSLDDIMEEYGSNRGDVATVKKTQKDESVTISALKKQFRKELAAINEKLRIAFLADKEKVAEERESLRYKQLRRLKKAVREQSAREKSELKKIALRFEVKYMELEIESDMLHEEAQTMYTDPVKRQEYTNQLYRSRDAKHSQINADYNKARLEAIRKREALKGTATIGRKLSKKEEAELIDEAPEIVALKALFDTELSLRSDKQRQRHREIEEIYFVLKDSAHRDELYKRETEKYHKLKDDQEKRLAKAKETVRLRMTGETSGKASGKKRGDFAEVKMPKAKLSISALKKQFRKELAAINEKLRIAFLADKEKVAEERESLRYKQLRRLKKAVREQSAREKSELKKIALRFEVKYMELEIESDMLHEEAQTMYTDPVKRQEYTNQLYRSRDAKHSQINADYNKARLEAIRKREALKGTATIGRKLSKKEEAELIDEAPEIVALKALFDTELSLRSDKQRQRHREIEEIYFVLKDSAHRDELYKRETEKYHKLKDDQEKRLAKAKETVRLRMTGETSGKASGKKRGDFAEVKMPKAKLSISALKKQFRKELAAINEKLRIAFLADKEKVAEERESLRYKQLRRLKKAVREQSAREKSELKKIALRFEVKYMELEIESDMLHEEAQTMYTDPVKRQEYTNQLYRSRDAKHSQINADYNKARLEAIRKREALKGTATIGRKLSKKEEAELIDEAPEIVALKALFDTELSLRSDKQRQRHREIEEIYFVLKDSAHRDELYKRETEKYHKLKDDQEKRLAKAKETVRLRMTGETSGKASGKKRGDFAEVKMPKATKKMDSRGQDGLGKSSVQAFLASKLDAIQQEGKDAGKEYNLVVKSADLKGAGFNHPLLTKNVLEALYSIAAEHHREQKRKDTVGTNYLAHVLGVVSILVNELGVTDPNVIAAAFLHDVFEDSIMYFKNGERDKKNGNEITDLDKRRDLRDIIIEEIQNHKYLKDSGLSLNKNVNGGVISLGRAMTKEDGMDLMSVYYPGLVKQGTSAVALKVADRMYNLRDLKHAASDMDDFVKIYFFGGITNKGKEKEGTIKEFIGNGFVGSLPRSMQVKFKVTYLNQLLANYKRVGASPGEELTPESLAESLKEVDARLAGIEKSDVEKMISEAIKIVDDMIIITAGEKLEDMGKDEIKAQVETAGKEILLGIGQVFGGEEIFDYVLGATPTMLDDGEAAVAESPLTQLKSAWKKMAKVHKLDNVNVKFGLGTEDARGMIREALEKSRELSKRKEKVAGNKRVHMSLSQTVIEELSKDNKINNAWRKTIGIEDGANLQSFLESTVMVTIINDAVMAADGQAEVYIARYVPEALYGLTQLASASAAEKEDPEGFDDAIRSMAHAIGYISNRSDITTILEALEEKIDQVGMKDFYNVVLEIALPAVVKINLEMIKEEWGATANVLRSL